LALGLAKERKKRKGEQREKKEDEGKRNYKLHPTNRLCFVFLSIFNIKKLRVNYTLPVVRPI
jgi:hypothetical protein